MRQLKISKQITNRDSQSLNKYLNEVSSVGDVITVEEEVELTRRIKEGDMDARDKLCNANLRFVISVAKQYGSKNELPDLISEGNIGLIKAAMRFDETKGFKFISYAVWWIRQSIMQYISDNGRKIRLPLNKVSVINKINQASSILEQYLERKPTAGEISEYLMSLEFEKTNGDPKKFRKEEVEEMLAFTQPMASLDAPMSSDSDAGSLKEVMPTEDECDVTKSINRSDLQIEIERSMDRLSQKEQDVLIMFFGLFDTPQLTLEEIGNRFDLTRERVRQIKEKSIRKLKVRSQQSRLKEYTCQ